MKGIALLTGVCLAGVAVGAGPVGRPLSEVAVPVAQVTMPLDAVTVSEAAVAYSGPTRVLTQGELVLAVQTGASNEDRMKAMGRICDQDAFFRLVFKPGEDRSDLVRTEAVNNIVEVDVLRCLAAKCQIESVRKTAESRLKMIYAEVHDRSCRDVPPVVRGYARRLRETLSQR